ncbi:fungal-specific transcription factor domain-containing protein [Entophlyctis helioformis]|nr:fungal-specific transcription factor domain-containing protein [Entophlyctis helioformis]
MSQDLLFATTPLSIHVNPPLKPEIRRDLLDVFFAFVSAKRPVLHRRSFLANVENESPFLLYAMYASAESVPYRLLQNTSNGFNSGLQYYNIAKRFLEKAVGEPSLSNLFGISVLASFAGSVGLVDALLYFGLAIRMGQGLMLHQESASEINAPSTSVVQEMRRRLWWMLLEMDRITSFMTQMPFAISERDMNIGLPESDIFDDDYIAPRDAESTLPFMKGIGTSSNPESITRSRSNSDSSTNMIGSVHSAATSLSNGGVGSIHMGIMDHAFDGPVMANAETPFTPSNIANTPEEIEARRMPPPTWYRGYTANKVMQPSQVEFNAYKHYLKLLKIFGKIVLFLRDVSHLSSDLKDIQSSLLDTSLKEWFEASPEWLRFVSDVYGDDQRSPQIPCFRIAFILAFYHYSIIILHIRDANQAVLDAPNQAHTHPAMQKCLYAALMIAELARRFLRGDPWFNYATAFMGNCITESAMVLLTCSRLSGVNVPVDLFELIQSNVRALEHISTFFVPMTAQMERVCARRDGIRAEMAAAAATGSASNSSGGAGGLGSGVSNGSSGSGAASSGNDSSPRDLASTRLAVGSDSKDGIAEGAVGLWDALRHMTAAQSEMDVSTFSHPDAPSTDHPHDASSIMSLAMLASSSFSISPTKNQQATSMPRVLPHSTATTGSFDYLNSVQQPTMQAHSQQQQQQHQLMMMQQQHQQQSQSTLVEGGTMCSRPLVIMSTDAALSNETDAPIDPSITSRPSEPWYN